MYIFETEQQTLEDLRIGRVSKSKSVLQQTRQNGKSLLRQPSKIKDTAFRPENSLVAALREITFIKQPPFLEKVVLDAQDSIFKPGDRIKYLYFPESAVFSEFQLLEDGRAIETAVIAGEGVAGLIPFLSGSGTGSWMQVLIAGSAVRISTDVFRPELNLNVRLQAVLFNYLNNYTNQLLKRIACNSFHPVKQRFCGWLKTTGQKCVMNKLPLTQEQIALSLGVHRPTISQVAKVLQRAGIIDYRRGSITILNHRKLEEMVCDCFRQTNLH